MKRILIVDSNPSELNKPIIEEIGMDTGAQYAEVLHALCGDLETVVVHPYDGEEVPDLAGFDGVVFTGSGVEWNTDDARAEPLAAIMRGAFGAGRPVIGSCNGMQLAASVLDGSSDVSPNGREDGLAQDIRLTEAGRAHPMMAGRRDGYAAPCVHRDEVVRLPEGAVLLAGNDHSRVQAFAYERGDVRFWGMQYHPEYAPAFLGGYLGRTWRVPEAVAADLGRVEQDAEAAVRLGTTPEDQQLPGRAVELSNWLASL